MSRFWAAASSSEGEKDSDSDSFDEQQQTQRVAGGKFGATFQESDSGEYLYLLCGFSI
jgi:hypothetical protein